MTTQNLWSSGPISLIEAIASLTDARGGGEWSRGDDAGVDRAEPPADDDDGTASEALLGVGSGGTLGCGRSWAVLEETTGAAVAEAREDGEAEGDEAGLSGRR
jgi:hypothetical protein